MINNYKEEVLKLEIIQEWMQTVLISRGDLIEKIETANEKLDIPLNELIKETEKFPSLKRLNVYATGYVLRLVECLKSQFPMLLSFLGESMFEMFAKAYIVTLPSTSWSLTELGASFSIFFDKTKPKNLDRKLNQTLIDLPIEITKYEETKLKVIYSKGNEGEKSDIHFQYLFNLISENNFIERIRNIELLEFEYPIHKINKNVRMNVSNSLPNKQKTYLVISRKNYQEKITEIKDWQYYILSNLKVEKTINTIKQETFIQFSKRKEEIDSEFLNWYLLMKENNCIW
ncbi:DNA-binding domain-containing protein [Aureivirga sp. CE67]|uniref:HvfC/BufC N-terminal domain-containing protein n=1 Tax=Aureivirga sp. CE67 TaxID=1788983 RepID=UPI0018C8ECE2|nr:DNA-binding domain-containing protein [Aureivirga sp. CE67]